MKSLQKTVSGSRVTLIKNKGRREGERKRGGPGGLGKNPKAQVFKYTHQVLNSEVAGVGKEEDDSVKTMVFPRGSYPCSTFSFFCLNHPPKSAQVSSILSAAPV